MTNTKKYKVLTLLESLEAAELKQFIGFIRSDFLDINPKVILLLELLAPGYPVFEMSKIDPEHIYAQLYPDNTYNNGHFRNLLSELVKCVYRFLQHLELEDNPLQADRLLLKQLSKRKL